MATLDSVEEYIQELCRSIKIRQPVALMEELKEICRACSRIGDVSPRMIDLIISYGERMAAEILTAAIESNGITARSVSLHDLVPKNSNGDFYDEFTKKLQNIRGDYEGVLVLTGYFGRTPQSLIESGGRGYSDFCAAMVATAVQAKELVIWKQVAGVYSADPRKNPSAKLRTHITPEEASELSFYGAEVIHPKTMWQAVKGGVPVRVAPLQNDSDGTLITDANVGDNNDWATAVTMREGIAIIDFGVTEENSLGACLAEVLVEFSKLSHVNVEMVSTGRANISIAYSSHHANAVPVKLGGVNEIRRRQNMVIVSLVGREMRMRVGTSGKMLSALGRAGVNVEMIAQGASEINISCVVAAEQAMLAVKALHEMVIQQS